MCWSVYGMLRKGDVLMFYIEVGLLSGPGAECLKTKKNILPLVGV